VRTLERHLGSIALLAKLLPLLGCLGTATELANGFLPLGRLASYPSVATFSPVLLSAFAAALLGICGGIVLQLSHHLLHGRLRSCVREIYSGARELYCECLVRGEGQKPCETSTRRA
jgi:biopolymer transport protein ExbB/TolQ